MAGATKSWLRGSFVDELVRLFPEQLHREAFRPRQIIPGRFAFIPAAAKAAIEKKVATGKITMVEAVTKNGAVALYEASYTMKTGKKAEFAVKPDGTPTKED